MQIVPHSSREFTEALKALLPEGAAWVWPQGGSGDTLLLGTAEELARVELATQAVLDNAIEIHRPSSANWHLNTYRQVAAQAVSGVVETMPRSMCAVGGHIGDRLWSSAAPGVTFPVELVQVDHLVGPFRAGSHVGDRCWGSRGRFVLRVRYYRSVVEPKVIWDALFYFKQAHVFLWFEDITGSGGEVSYAQD